VNLITAMKAKEGIRVTYRDRWLVYDSGEEMWFVYSRGYAQKKTRLLIETDILEDAVDVLLEGD